MAAGKTYDVMINVPAAGATALPVFDRELSLSGNAIGRDAGMLGYIGMNGRDAAGRSHRAQLQWLVPITIRTSLPGQTLTVSDPAKGVIANDTNVYGVKLLAPATSGTADPERRTEPSPMFRPGQPRQTRFTYCANGAYGGVCSSGISATVTSDRGHCRCGRQYHLHPSTHFHLEFVQLHLRQDARRPGELQRLGRLSAHRRHRPALCPQPASPCMRMPMADSLPARAAPPAGGSTSFTFQAKNSYGVSSAPVTVSITFPAGSGLSVKVVDGSDKITAITDYRWIIEEDRTFYIDPNCTTNPPPAGCRHATTASAHRTGVPSFPPSEPTSTPATCRWLRPAAPGHCPANRTDRAGSSRGLRRWQRRLQNHRSTAVAL